MLRDVLALLARVYFERLAHFLVVATVPVEESRLEEDLLLGGIHLSELYELHPLEVATILALELLLDEFLQTLRVGEESIVLHNLKLLALRVLRDANVLALKDLWAQVALIQVEFLASLASVALRERVRGDHSANILVHLELRLLSLLLGVVHVFKLVQIHRVELEVSHIHLVFHFVSSLGDEVHSAPLSVLNQCVDILVTKFISDGEDSVSAIVDHILHLILAKGLTFGRKTSLLDDHRVEFQLEGLSLDHLLLHGVDSDEAEHLHDALLADTMGAIHSLQVHLWVPVGVV
mmetsp:Transcript_15923/g.21579  ORF Transcript_15923/g.21579 Transcript_15923/m.21579 type:complete len:292 (-) Transcript_15923:1927-2802(-)